ncbi:MAG: hypothetical protein CVU06_10615, partial [Bacteroidetes bacterium HGW-Bacteroidetes-22]
MKRCLINLMLMLSVTLAFGQTVQYADNFSSYTTGMYLAQQNGTWWTTWSNMPGGTEDGKITQTYANSPVKAVLIEGANDQILKLGNKISGNYDLKWWMYVETGKCGYFNIQHNESPGVEWAYEVYLNADGTGKLMAGGNDYYFNYPKNTWFEVNNNIDLDNDWIQLSINNVLVNAWPFSYRASDISGVKQLGSLNFFAGGEAGETPKYYFDDVQYILNGSANDPAISVNPTGLSLSLTPGGAGSRTITVSNVGLANLNYTTNIIYDLGGKKAMSPEPGQMSQTATLKKNFIQIDPTPSPATITPVPDDFVLHYDGDNSSAIGFGTVPVTVSVASRFLNQHTLPHAGMSISSVDIMINDLNSTGSNQMTLLVYGMGTSFEPGSLIYSQTFTPYGNSWEHIVLNTPVMVTGEELWIGYSFSQRDEGIFIPGTDAGPNDPNGDWFKNGIAWSHLSNNASLPYNWNIRANLTGTPMSQWLTVSPSSGTVMPNGSSNLNVSFNAANLTNGVYQARIIFISNDPENTYLEVPVTLIVFQSQLMVAGLFSSQNIYTSLIVEQTCIAYNSDINALMFTARGNTGSIGTGNDICTAVSTNGGTTFTSAVSATAPSQGSNRYPSGTLYNPDGNTNPYNAKKVFTAPISDGSAWIGNNFATNNWSNSSLKNQFRTTGAMGDLLIRGGLDVDGNGFAHQAAVESNSTSTYTQGIVFRGEYNNSTGAFSWTDQNVSVPAYVNTNDNINILKTIANVAFSPDGSVGYAMF